MAARLGASFAFPLLVGSVAQARTLVEFFDYISRGPMARRSRALLWTMPSDSLPRIQDIASFCSGQGREEFGALGQVVIVAIDAGPRLEPDLALGCAGKDRSC